MPQFTRSCIPKPNKSSFFRASCNQRTLFVHSYCLYRSMMGLELVLNTNNFLLLIVKVLNSHISNVLVGSGNTESLIWYLRTCIETQRINVTFNRMKKTVITLTKRILKKFDIRFRSNHQLCFWRLNFCWQDRSRDCYLRLAIVFKFISGKKLIVRKILVLTRSNEYTSVCLCLEDWETSFNLLFMDQV
jgi:hypothetical protein